MASHSMVSLSCQIPEHLQIRKLMTHSADNLGNPIKTANATHTMQVTATVTARILLGKPAAAVAAVAEAAASTEVQNRAAAGVAHQKEGIRHQSTIGRQEKQRGLPRRGHRLVKIGIMVSTLPIRVLVVHR